MKHVTPFPVVPSSTQDRSCYNKTILPTRPTNPFCMDAVPAVTVSISGTSKQAATTHVGTTTRCLTQYSHLTIEQRNQKIRELARETQTKGIKHQIKSLKGLNDIEASLRAKVTLSECEFIKKKDKDAGYHQGYTGLDKATEKLAELKIAPKVSDTDDATRRCRKELVNEFLASIMYQFLLPSRVPTVALVTTATDSSNSRMLYLRSKYLVNSNGTPAQILAEFYSSKTLSGFEGLEEVIAAANILGDTDCHNGNLLVVDGLVRKIDHGLALDYNKLGNFSGLIGSLNSVYDANARLISTGKVLFNVIKYHECLVIMTHRLTDDIISTMVVRRLYELQQTGFDHQRIDSELDKKIAESAKEGTELAKTETDSKEVKFRILATHYEEKARLCRKNIQENAVDVGIITKFDEMSKEFINGGWIPALVQYCSPIEYAIKKCVTIEGKDPLLWSIETNTPINKQDPIVWAAKNGRKIEDKDPIIWAVEHGKQIVGEDPCIWACINGVNIDEQDPIIYFINNTEKIKGQDPIAWAVDNSKRINYKDPLEWAQLNNLTVENQDPIAWAVENNKHINYNYHEPYVF